ncbi:MAG: hypothetical protein ACREXU_06360, partial [Gammaproteobacteria bacterium]
MGRATEVVTILGFPEPAALTRGPLLACRQLRIDALGRALKGEFDGLSGAPQSGEIFGVVFALKRLADEVGIT